MVVNELQNQLNQQEKSPDQQDSFATDDSTESLDPEVSLENTAETTNQDPLLILVNKNNPLPEDYEVSLKTLPDGVNKAAVEAYQPLCDMLNAGRKEGLSFEICSSYRSVEKQEELFYEDLETLIRRGYSYE